MRDLLFDININYAWPAN